MTTTPNLHDQDQDRFLVSDRSCPKTDGHISDHIADTDNADRPKSLTSSLVRQPYTEWTRASSIYIACLMVVDALTEAELSNITLRYITIHYCV